MTAEPWALFTKLFYHLPDYVATAREGRFLEFNAVSGVSRLLSMAFGEREGSRMADNGPILATGAAAQLGAVVGRWLSNRHDPPNAKR